MGQAQPGTRSFTKAFVLRRNIRDGASKVRIRSPISGHLPLTGCTFRKLPNLLQNLRNVQHAIFFEQVAAGAEPLSPPFCMQLVRELWCGGLLAYCIGQQRKSCWQSQNLKCCSHDFYFAQLHARHGAATLQSNQSHRSTSRSIDMCWRTPLDSHERPSVLYNRPEKIMLDMISA